MSLFKTAGFLGILSALVSAEARYIRLLPIVDLLLLVIEGIVVLPWKSIGPLLSTES